MWNSSREMRDSLFEMGDSRRRMRDSPWVGGGHETGADRPEPGLLWEAGPPSEAGQVTFRAVSRWPLTSFMYAACAA
jgi:hypothetical protein